jgi:hypothetical protein
MLKLINNSSYGYFGMKPDHGKGVKLHTNVESCRKDAWASPNADVKILQYDEDTGAFLGLTRKYSRKAEVVKTARIVMWAILDYAKVKLMGGH